MAEGDFGATIQQMKSEDFKSEWNRIVHVVGDVYAIAHKGPDSDGFLRSVTIDSDGVMALIAGGSLEFNTSYAYGPDIIHVAGDVYAIAHRGPGEDNGIIDTVTISATGAMASVVEGFVLDSGKVFYPRIIHVAGSIFVVSYWAATTVMKLQTVTISAAGVVSLVGMDSQTFTGYSESHQSITHVSGDIYAIAYTGPDIDGFVQTVTIDVSGDIALVGGGNLEFEIANCLYPDIIHITGNIYAVAYKGPSNYGHIRTMTISGTGAMVLLGASSFTFNTAVTNYPVMLHISGEAYVVVYETTGGAGWAKSVFIDSAGAISWADSTGKDIGNVQGWKPDIKHVANSVYVAAYSLTDTKGWLTSFSIETIPVAVPAAKHLMMMGIG